jgi:two-component system nitrogen regulation response regulator GlnG
VAVGSEGEGDVVLTDVVLPDESGFDVLPRIKARRPRLPVIVMSARNTIMTAITASERGAYDYLAKPFDLSALVSTVGQALEDSRKSEPVSAHRDLPDDTDSLPIVGRSQIMQNIYRIVARMTQTDLTVMIQGESGTGKELVARALHDFSRRKGAPFVAMNMAAIPRELIESELFGHEKGAFTGLCHAIPAGSSRPMAERCSSTKSVTCRWRRRRGCCACCRRASTRRSVACARSRRMCASLLPRTAIFSN